METVIEKAAASKAAFAEGDFKTASRLFYEVRAEYEGKEKIVQLGDGTVAIEKLDAKGNPVHMPVE